MQYTPFAIEKGYKLVSNATQIGGIYTSFRKMNQIDKAIMVIVYNLRYATVKLVCRYLIQSYPDADEKQVMKNIYSLVKELFLYKLALYDGGLKKSPDVFALDRKGCAWLNQFGLKSEFYSCDAETIFKLLSANQFALYTGYQYDEKTSIVRNVVIHNDEEDVPTLIPMVISSEDSDVVVLVDSVKGTTSITELEKRLLSIQRYVTQGYLPFKVKSVLLFDNDYHESLYSNILSNHSDLNIYTTTDQVTNFPTSLRKKIILHHVVATSSSYDMEMKASIGG